MIDLIRAFARCMLSMIPADDDAAYGFNIHHDRNHHERKKDLVEECAEKYQGYPDIASQTEYLARIDPGTHETVVFVRCIAQHEGTDDRKEANQQDESLRFVCVLVPGEAKKQKGVCVAVQHRIEPRAVGTALELEPCHFAITAVDDRGELCQKAAQQKG